MYGWIRLFNRVYDEILEHVTATRFVNDLTITSEQERELLTFFHEKEVLSSKNIRNMANPAMLFKRLEEKGLLVKVKRGYFRLYHPLFREYLTASLDRI